MANIDLKLSSKDAAAMMRPTVIKKKNSVVDNNDARECMFMTYSLAHIGIMSYFPKDLNILVMHFFFCSMFG